MHTTPLPGAVISMTLDSRHNRVIALSSTSHNAWLTALDRGRGAAPRSIALPLTATMLALDAEAGHVFVLDGGGYERRPDPWRGVPGWVPRGLWRWLPLLPHPGAYTRFVPPRVLMFDAARSDV